MALDTAAGGLDGFGASVHGPACVFGQQVDGVHVGAHAAAMEQPIGAPAGQGGVDHALDAGLVHAQGPEQVQGQVPMPAHGPAQLDVRARADEAGGRIAARLHVGQDLTRVGVQVVHVVAVRESDVETTGTETRPWRRRAGSSTQAWSSQGRHASSPTGAQGNFRRRCRPRGKGRGIWSNKSNPIRTTASKCIRQVPGPPPVWVAVGS